MANTVVQKAVAIASKGKRSARRLYRLGKRAIRVYKARKKSRTVFLPQNMYKRAQPKTVADMRVQYCAGCTACANACPKGAIAMREDENGFLSAFVDFERCVNCGRCVQVCPVMNRPKGNRRVRTCYAIQNDTEVREKSSSGGAFSLIADEVLANHGYICGAALEDDFRVRHIIVNDEAGLARLRKSKYTQSDLGGVFREIRSLLQSGSQVLFTGCPCQVAGLRNYLGKTYENLILVDLVCHGGVANPAFRKYIQEEYGGDLQAFSFRTKDYGYMSFVHQAVLPDGDSRYNVYPVDLFQFCMHSGLGLKYICSECPFAAVPRQGDITIGDFWGLGSYKKPENDFADGKGSSVVLVNNARGEAVYEKVRSKLYREITVPFKVARSNNRFGQHIERPYCHDAFQTMVRKQPFHKSVDYAMRRKYDIGIVGLWNGWNYGSHMTYYALYRFLTDLGYSVLMIGNLSKLRFNRNPSSLRTIAFSKKYYGNNIRQIADLSPKLNELNAMADTFICGSDQLWNYRLSCTRGWVYYLDFADASKRKIAYATSFGTDHIFGDQRVKSVTKSYLERFDAISLREDNGVELLRDSFGLEGTQVLDPVFLLDEQEYDRVTEDVHVQMPGEYVLAYILDPTPEKRRAVQSVGERLGCPVVIMLDGTGGRIKFKENKERIDLPGVVENLTTEQWVNYFRHARFVITDSCHGASFSIIFRKPFVAISNSGRGSVRFNSLTKLFGLTDRLVEDPLEIIEHSDQYLSDIDYDAVDVIMQRERARSRQWLKDALAIPKPGLPNIEL